MRGFLHMAESAFWHAYVKRVVTRWIRIGQALACWSLLLAAVAPTPVAMSIGGGSDAVALATARMVRSFIDYSRWPVRPEPMTLCVVGSPSNAGRLDELALGDGRRVAVRAISPGALAASGCDVAYFGRVDPVIMRQALIAVRGKGVLTIAENDPQCRSQAMFCLRQDRASLAFGVNIDAISRSGLRIDPRVLRIADGAAT
jgi:hypothetical protein